MDNLREILVSEITGLKSLLRLNADGVGDDDDLVAQLTRIRISLEKFSAELLGSTRSMDVITPDTLPSSISSSPTRSSSGLNSNRSSTTTAASLDDCAPSGGGGGNVGGLEEDDAFLRLSSLLAGLQAQAEAAVSSGFSTSAPTTPLVRAFMDSDSNSSADDDATVSPGSLGSSGEVGRKCELTRTLSLPHPFLAPAPRRLRKAATIGASLREENASAASGGRDRNNPTVNITSASDSPLSSGAGGDTGFPPTPPPSLRRRGRPESRHRPTLSDVFDVPSPTPTTPDRRNSPLPKELEIEGLLTEFLEDRAKVEMGFRWVWVYLLGGGMVWALVGWLLGWGCVECAVGCELGR
ncbi:hypothetical protein C7212DRAFT_352210 [Tuber magnatum]|uniref:Uncharacterized protein n=1 Tax=Tuber magnatum TaxID=42249 RepID=A0A317SR12_9PEZI|nr:hypothetical protein C7212DRAFT_352210 [Tuber magnatum]